MSCCDAVVATVCAVSRECDSIAMDKQRSPRACWSAVVLGMVVAETALSPALRLTALREIAGLQPVHFWPCLDSPSAWANPSAVLSVRACRSCWWRSRRSSAASMLRIRSLTEAGGSSRIFPPTTSNAGVAAPCARLVCCLRVPALDWILTTAS